MSWRSLRVRLTVTFVAIGAMIIVGGYAGTAWLLARTVWHPLDAALHEEATTLDLAPEDAGDAANARLPDPGVRTLADASDIPLLVERLAAERDLGPGKFVVVSAASGAVIAAAGEVPPGLDTQPIADGARFLQDASSTYRVVTRRMADGGWARLGIRVNEQVRTLRRSLWALAFGALAMLAAIAALAWSITARAMREIDVVTSELESLEVDALHRRLSPRNTVEVVRLTEALNRLLERLELAGRRLQRFTADAAHELRTPLAALRAHLDIALARTPSLDTYRNGLLDAVEQTERLSMLAEDLLTLSSIESSDPPRGMPVDIGLLAKEVAEFLDAVAQEQGRRFEVVIDQPAIVGGEAPLLKRLLLNLLGNAFVHTAHGVSVTLVVRNEPGAVVVEVLDRGGGIGRADQQVLFERFASRRAGRGGSGLGLAICREIVTRHHGSISIDSGSDRGTSVRVRFPSLDDPSTGTRRTT